MELLLNEAAALAVILAPVIAILVQLIKQTAINTRWLPFVSIAIGLLTGVVFGAYMGADLFLYGLAGFLSGAGASGLFDAIKSAKG